MADDVTGTTVPVPPHTHLTDEQRQLFIELADRITARRPCAQMTELLAHAHALTVAEHTHGPTPAAELAQRALIDVLPLVRDRQTRNEYAAQLRLLAQGVSL